MTNQEQVDDINERIKAYARYLLEAFINSKKPGLPEGVLHPFHCGYVKVGKEYVVRNDNLPGEPSYKQPIVNGTEV